MGKKLIIKGADFSDHPVAVGSWVIDSREYEPLATTNASVPHASFVPNAYASLQGKTITKIRLVPAVAGNISVMKGSAINDGNAVVAATLVVTDDMLNVPTEFSVNINVGANDVIGMNKSTDTGVFKYTGPQTGTLEPDFKYMCFRSDYIPGQASTAERLTVSFYCE